MPIVTIFKKSNCVYCARVIQYISDIIESVKKEEQLRVASTVDLDSALKLNIVNISKRPSLAALCMRISRSITVPQIFYNDIHLGNATTFNCWMQGTMEGRAEVPVRERCPEVYDRILELVLKDAQENKLKDKIDFPPPEKTRMIKVTENLAFSSIPTRKQQQSLKRFGFNSVVNIIGFNSLTFDDQEKDLMLKSNIEYLHCPLFTSNAENFLESIKSILKTNMTPPLLIHDDQGTSAGLLALFLATTILLKTSTMTIIELKKLFNSWLKDLNLIYDTEEEQVMIDTVLKALLHDNF